MKEKLNCILLVDDDKDCNFSHKRLLKKMDCTESIEIVTDGKLALEFVKTKRNTPALILLDINMPKMDGWEFLVEYEKLTEEEKAKTVVVMLTSSLNPDDRIKAETFSVVKGFYMKYLDKESVEKILLDNFTDHFPLQSSPL